jgi:hypothetical protein
MLAFTGGRDEPFAAPPSRIRRKTPPTGRWPHSPCNAANAGKSPPDAPGNKPQALGGICLGKNATRPNGQSMKNGISKLNPLGWDSRVKDRKRSGNKESAAFPTGAAESATRRSLYPPQSLSAGPRRESPAKCVVPALYSAEYFPQTLIPNRGPYTFTLLSAFRKLPHTQQWML